MKNVVMSFLVGSLVCAYALPSDAAPRGSVQLAKANALQRRLNRSLTKIAPIAMTATSGVTNATGVVVITPDPLASINTAIVSYEMLNGVLNTVVNLNGVGTYFNDRQVGLISFDCTGLTGAMMFRNNTGHSVSVRGGFGSNHFIAGPGQNVFYGGFGTNTFDGGTGYTLMVGGLGTNVFNESFTGSGLILKRGTNNTVNRPANSTGYYTVAG